MPCASYDPEANLPERSGPVKLIAFVRLSIEALAFLPTMAACAHVSRSNGAVEQSAASASVAQASPQGALSASSPPPTAPSSVPGEKSTMAKQYQKPSDDVLRARLSSLAYQVTQKEGTEPPFANEY